MKAAGPETNLKSGIDISNMLDRGKFQLLMNPQFLVNSPKLSTRLASTDKRPRGIERKSVSFEGDYITSRLVLFFNEENFETSFGKEGRSG
jgi:hypothetical protein